mmetsp:Transcript_13201/g.37646  ORF Transcript_13201/g.37646 Transcript_13201/m.37646 type:complete len:381 (+) Transcript_13201:1279-2421(+)
MTLFVLAPFLRLYRFIHPPIPARECAVCCSELSDEEAAVTLDCHGRDMHLHCLRQWTRTKNDCPICRGGALPLNIWEDGFTLQSKTAGGTNNVGAALGRLSGRGVSGEVCHCSFSRGSLRFGGRGSGEVHHHFLRSSAHGVVAFVRRLYLPVVNLLLFVLVLFVLQNQMRQQQMQMQQLFLPVVNLLLFFLILFFLQSQMRLQQMQIQQMQAQLNQSVPAEATPASQTVAMPPTATQTATLPTQTAMTMTTSVSDQYGQSPGVFSIPVSTASAAIIHLSRAQEQSEAAQTKLIEIHRESLRNRHKERERESEIQHAAIRGRAAERQSEDNVIIQLGRALEQRNAENLREAILVVKEIVEKSPAPALADLTADFIGEEEDK